MTLYLVQDTTSGDVFVTDERTMNDIKAEYGLDIH